MFTEKFFEVLNYEGAVAIVSWGKDEPHMVNTWNSYLTITEDERILIPAAGMTSLTNDLAVNNKVKITLATREIQGSFTLGCGFRIEGTAKFTDSGEEFYSMKERFPFLNRVLEITVTSLRQTL